MVNFLCCRNYNRVDMVAACVCTAMLDRFGILATVLSATVGIMISVALEHHAKR